MITLLVTVNREQLVSGAGIREDPHQSNPWPSSHLKTSLAVRETVEETKVEKGWAQVGQRRN